VLNDASIINRVDKDGIGDSGNIEITATTLSLLNGAQILTNTLGQGNAGNVEIRADQVVIDGFRRDRGVQKPSRSGNISIFRSGIYSSVESSAVGNGGNVGIAANSLSITNTGFITVGTVGRGNAGSINVNADKVFMNNSTITANSSSAQGEAGEIQVQADILRLANRSAILSDTVSGKGGDINLSIDKTLVLSQQSRISSTAGLAGSGGDGGNIRIQAARGFIIAPLREDSNISANAYTGRGGTVRIEILSNLVYD
jgi:large exoprotein involved in heme utilization and adhesion